MYNGIILHKSYSSSFSGLSSVSFYICTMYLYFEQMYNIYCTSFCPLLTSCTPLCLTHTTCDLTSSDLKSLNPWKSTKFRIRKSPKIDRKRLLFGTCCLLDDFIINRTEVHNYEGGVQTELGWRPQPASSGTMGRSPLRFIGGISFSVGTNVHVSFAPAWHAYSKRSTYELVFYTETRPRWERSGETWKETERGTGSQTARDHVCAFSLRVIASVVHSINFWSARLRFRCTKSVLTF